ncbi:hypothetical protein BDQ94DRAFT_152035, partial [Aspergillus welwitschiae]
MQDLTLEKLIGFVIYISLYSIIVMVYYLLVWVMYTSQSQSWILLRGRISCQGPMRWPIRDGYGSGPRQAGLASNFRRAALTMIIDNRTSIF